MARKIRIEFPGAAYHVMARGNQLRAIYEDTLDAKQDHGEQQAERLLQRALSALKIRSSHLAEARKGMREKQVFAWWLCQHTTVRRRWVSERLAMGDESRVTQAIRSINLRGRSRKTETLSMKSSAEPCPEPGNRR